ncbi:hypothetical protein CRG98_022675 [Punica granatum]|uniref:Reverse transcriptase domain-containing protein n=1 Tax=Punica granatum TaxID=22663 RepID=A0A2I0JLZ9_PUNGR|nr:hypothetical protein CRG98_022675 [Punica granatum]
MDYEAEVVRTWELGKAIGPASTDGDAPILQQLSGYDSRDVANFRHESAARSSTIVSTLKDPSSRLHGWNTETFGHVDRSVPRIENEINKLQFIDESRRLDNAEISRARSLQEQLGKWHRMQESLWRQKSRIQWCKLGDTNTRLFRLSTSIRGSGNRLCSLNLNDASITSQPSIIKEEVRNYFLQLYSLDSNVVPLSPGLEFKSISTSTADYLEALFDIEEIKAAVWDCESSKVLGFNFFFIEKSWSIIIGLDIVAMVQDFYRTGKLPKGINCSFISLIPKFVGTSSLKDFRPISLVGCLNKIIAKLLSRRLQGVMKEVISDTQHAFMKC